MMTETAANADQITYWNEVAGAKWAANQERLDRLMAPLTEGLMVGAAARTGERVLDVGCGCGDVALRFAAIVGTSGHVAAVDVSAPMLAHAVSREAALPAGGRVAVDWQQADAMTRRFPADRDLVVSRFGVMFFDDPIRAFANLRSAMRPGARLAVLAWRRRSDVEWMNAPLEWLSALQPIPEDATGAIGPFALADPEATCRMLARAGLADVTAEPVDASLTIGAGAADEAAVDDALVLLCGTGPAAASLRATEPDARIQGITLLRAGIEGRVSAGRVALGGACWLYRSRA